MLTDRHIHDNPKIPWQTKFDTRTTMMTTTQQRVAVVTGANKGIGFYIALQLALSGKFSDIILGCRDPQRGLQAEQDIKDALSSSAGGGGGAAAAVAPDADATSPKVQYVPLTIGDKTSHTQFCQRMDQEFGGGVDVLVNNAGFAYKGSDPTPFEGQTRKTLDINYFGLVDFTEQMIPLLEKGDGTDKRIVNVASMAGRLSQVSSELQKQFTDPNLTIPKLNELMTKFHDDVQNGVHRQNGWSNSNYGMSKLGVIAATKVWSQMYESNELRVMACCPGYCSTDMSSHKGSRSAEDGAKNAVMLATMDNPPPPTGCFFQNYEVSSW